MHQIQPAIPRHILLYFCVRICVSLGFGTTAYVFLLIKNSGMHKLITNWRGLSDTQKIADRRSCWTLCYIDPKIQRGTKLIKDSHGLYLQALKYVMVLEEKGMCVCSSLYRVLNCIAKQAVLSCFSTITYLCT